MELHPGPQPVPPPAAPPPPAARPLLDLHWLDHPALTGLTPDQFTALVTATEPGWHAHQELKRYRSRGGPRRKSPAGGGHNRRLDLTGQLLVTALARHLSLPHRLIGALTGAHPATISHAISDIRTILGPRITTIPATPTRLRTQPTCTPTSPPTTSRHPNQRVNNLQVLIPASAPAKRFSTGA